MDDRAVFKAADIFEAESAKYLAKGRRSERHLVRQIAIPNAHGEQTLRIRYMTDTAALW